MFSGYCWQMFRCSVVTVGRWSDVQWLLLADVQMFSGYYLLLMVVI